MLVMYVFLHEIKNFTDAPDGANVLFKHQHYKVIVSWGYS